MNHNHFEDGNLTSGRHVSYWTVSAPVAAMHGPLRDNLTTEVVVVGGGIAGVTIAYCLAEKGKKVVLVEDGYIGSGETGRTTGHLVTALDDRYYKIEKVHGEETARLAAESHQAAIDFVEKVTQKENINCDFERLNGYLFLHPSDKSESLEKEFEAARKSGVHVDMLESVPGIDSVKGPCLVFPNQAQFHSMKYLIGMCNALSRMGGRIFETTHAKEINSEGIVTEEGFSVKADHVVVATNSPVNDLVAMHTKQSAHRTYVLGAKVDKGSVPKALWWDTGDHAHRGSAFPYHYVRIQDYNGRHDLLISGGEDHITGKAGKEPEEERYRALEEWTREHFPVIEIDYAWSGQVMETMDALAFIGRNPWDKDNVYIATGDSGNGITHGTIAGMLITDLITGKENPWEKIYDPKRFKLIAAATTFVKENLGVLAEYLKDLPGVDEGHLTDVGVGEGKVIEIKGEKFGVYRDTRNELHMVSAVCTHLKCIVRWNADELSWDCPCHGSRFTICGKVINGPSNFDLPYHRQGADVSVAVAAEVKSNGNGVPKKKEEWSL